MNPKQPFAGGKRTAGCEPAVVAAENVQQKDLESHKTTIIENEPLRASPERFAEILPA
ncbi:MAG: hypothetical protein JSS81_17750 [Acidobacteria bacterium]|nr:hypothetical protein [Acidobacteriota bacterium]